MQCEKSNNLVTVHVSWVDINERKYVDLSDLLLLLYRTKATNISMDKIITFFEKLQSK